MAAELRTNRVRSPPPLHLHLATACISRWQKNAPLERAGRIDTSFTDFAY